MSLTFQALKPYFPIQAQLLVSMELLVSTQLDHTGVPALLAFMRSMVCVRQVKYFFLPRHLS